MPRNLDTSIASSIAPIKSDIVPILFADLSFASGMVYVWSGVGPFIYNGNTYAGVGAFGKISPIQEGTSVEAQGMVVSLSGIPNSPFPVSGTTPPANVTPPTTGPGEGISWIPANNVIAANAVPSGCLSQNSTVSLPASLVITPNTSACAAYSTWLQATGFDQPKLPVGAVITAIRPVVVSSMPFSPNLANVALNFVASAGTPIPITSLEPWNSPGVSTVQVGTGTTPSAGNIAATSSIGTDGTAITDAVIAIAFWTGQPQFADAEIDVQWIGLAVFYTTPTDSQYVSLVDEAMADMQIGGPATLRFGLLNNGLLLGTPYTLFKGQMDQPTVSWSPETSTIEIALESRLTNLSRPTQRRYTAADQHVAYPDDTGFNFVEWLNDIALRWG